METREKQIRRFQVLMIVCAVICGIGLIGTIVAGLLSHLLLTRLAISIMSLGLALFLLAAQKWSSLRVSPDAPLVGERKIGWGAGLNPHSPASKIILTVVVIYLFGLAVLIWF